MWRTAGPLTKSALVECDSIVARRRQAMRHHAIVGVVGWFGLVASACQTPLDLGTAEAAEAEAADTPNTAERDMEALAETSSAIERHDQALAELDEARVSMAAAYAAAESEVERAEVRARARKLLERTIIEDVFPAWLGMPWAMSKNSTATRPHEPGMSVGCSYFVTSVLQSAGVKLDNRYTFAQAPALHIQRSLAPDREDLHTYFSIPAASLRKQIKALGEGLYIIGLDTHVGFVVVRGDEVRLVHASYTGDRVVTDEPLEGARAIENSRPKGYFVTPLFTDGRLLDLWLRGQAVPFQKLGA